MTRHEEEEGIGEEAALLRYFGHTLVELMTKKITENCRFMVMGSRKVSGNLMYQFRSGYLQNKDNTAW
jgi:hypothetical protein